MSGQLPLYLPLNMCWRMCPPLYLAHHQLLLLTLWIATHQFLDSQHGPLIAYQSLLMKVQPKMVGISNPPLPLWFMKISGQDVLWPCLFPQKKNCLKTLHAKRLLTSPTKKMATLSLIVVTTGSPTCSHRPLTQPLNVPQLHHLCPVHSHLTAMFNLMRRSMW